MKNKIAKVIKTPEEKFMNEIKKIFTEYERAVRNKK